MTLTIIGIVVFLIGLFIPKEDCGTDLKPLKTGFKVVAVILAVIGLAWASYVSIPAGHRGVLKQFGAVKGILNEGVNWVTPFVSQTEVIETRSRMLKAKATAASKDLQVVHTELAINYHIEPGLLKDLYLTVGPEFEARIVAPAVQESLKAVTADYTAEELIRKRAEVKTKLDLALGERLKARFITVDPGGASITNFDFSQEFNAAIESKQAAQQNAEKQKYLLQQAKLEAETAIAAAEGRAKAVQVEAKSLQTQGGKLVLMQQWIARWNGTPPTVMGGNNGFMLDLKSLMAGAEGQ